MNATTPHLSRALKPVLKRHQAYLETLGEGEQAIVVQIEHSVVECTGEKLFWHEEFRGECVGFALERIRSFGGNEVPPERTNRTLIYVHRGFELLAMKAYVGQFVGDGVALPIGMVVRIDANDGNAFLQKCHSRKFIIEWRVLHQDSKGFRDSLYRHRRRLYTEALDELGRARFRSR
jgi:hypothetical protein